jgi:hypothetical protein
MNKRYRVRLTESEREHLEAVVSKGKAAAYKIKHAPILLKVDASGPQWSDERVAEAFGCHRRAIALCGLSVKLSSPCLIVRR